jgi:nucleoside-diphosphate-sugar epimerase
MRVLLTGASGFIGRAVAQALRERGHAVVRVLRPPRPDA